VFTSMVPLAVPVASSVCSRAVVVISCAAVVLCIRIRRRHLSFNMRTISRRSFFIASSFWQQCRSIRYSHGFS